MASVERVAFLGTGIMGSRIAANPAASGRARRVEPTRKRAEDVADAHDARVAATPAEAAAEAGAVVTMVSTLLRSRSAAARGGFLDAPVSGPKPKAGDATLTIMVGAEPDAYKRPCRSSRRWASSSCTSDRPGTARWSGAQQQARRGRRRRRGARP